MVIAKEKIKKNDIICISLKSAFVIRDNNSFLHAQGYVINAPQDYEKNQEFDFSVPTQDRISIEKNNIKKLNAIKNKAVLENKNKICELISIKEQYIKKTGKYEIS
jgi:hypothetical protein